jgi:hypothetical protein
MMEIQFFLNDHAYNYAITSLKEVLLERHSINLVHHFVRSAEDVRELFKECDLTLIHHDICPDWLANSKNCVALVPALDGGWCTPYYNLIPKVNAIITSYSYLPRELLNEPYFYYNMHLLRKAGYNAKNPQRESFRPFMLSEEDLEKFHVFCGFGSWERMEGIFNWVKQVDLVSERPIPIDFTGTVEYCGNEIEEHRKHAVKVCQDIGGTGINGRSLITWKYHEALKNTRVCLSPWGWGAACHRDFEALAMGCILVKPDWSFVESFPDISSKKAPYIPCRLDLADVPEIVEFITKHWDSYLNLRKRGRRLVKTALDKHLNAIKFADIVRKIVC